MTLRQQIVVLGLLALLPASLGCVPASPPASAPFSVVEASIAELQEAMAEGRVTSREIVQQYLQRIAYYENTLNAAMAVNRRALEEADRLDDERRAGRVRGPLHGIPIAIKDIINTTDMPTTGGALALKDSRRPTTPRSSPTCARRARCWIAKTVNTELANWMGSGMPGNYSAVGGYGMNPYDPRRDPRAGTSDGRPVMGTGGSSSRHRHGGESVGGERGHRNVGLDPQPVERHHARGDQTHSWTHQPWRHHSDHSRPGHGRSDGQERRRRGCSIRSDGRRVPGSAGPRHRRVRAAARRRLHTASFVRWATRRAYRHPRAGSTTTR